jgi:hypothetical protein
MRMYFRIELGLHLSMIMTFGHICARSRHRSMGKVGVELSRLGRITILQPSFRHLRRNYRLRIPILRQKTGSPIGDAAGFVIIRPLPGDLMPAPGVVKGYFMVRQGNSWLRVDSGQDSQVQPATITR